MDSRKFNLLTSKVHFWKLRLIYTIRVYCFGLKYWTELFCELVTDICITLLIIQCTSSFQTGRAVLFTPCMPKCSIILALKYSNDSSLNIWSAFFSACLIASLYLYFHWSLLSLTTCTPLRGRQNVVAAITWWWRSSNSSFHQCFFIFWIFLWECSYYRWRYQALYVQCYNTDQWLPHNIFHKSRYTLMPLLEELLSIIVPSARLHIQCMSALSHNYFKVLHLVEVSFLTWADGNVIDLEIA